MRGLPRRGERDRFATRSCCVEAIDSHQAESMRNRVPGAHRAFRWVLHVRGIQCEAMIEIRGSLMLLA